MRKLLSIIAGILCAGLCHAEPDFAYRMFQQEWAALTVTASTPGITDPNAISGCAVWLDANAGTNITLLFDNTTYGTYGLYVTSWVSKASASNIFQRGSGQLWNLYTNRLNGRSVIAPMASAGYFNCAAGAGTNQTFFFVCSMTNFVTAYADLFEYDSSSQAGLLLNNADTNTLFPGNASSIAYLPEAGGSCNSTNWINGVRTNSLPALWRMYSWALNSPYSVGVRTLYISGTSRAWACGEFAEVIIYNRRLTNAEIGQVETYLSTKWGIALP